ncbi:hypothetical protein [Maledivibacter halophilus]|uniref:Uncharacterized protein n=1 Tax=Maledivibacter halophilus TaxID=36842 RepID=A0A1T5KYE2_9FIRM|nr:hypothetical protein [Maledivibacter halophilus]SKC68767.1 hypothetical protein SAMN02194393_02185 [Maledivibacter halophilus]
MKKTCKEVRQLKKYFTWKEKLSAMSKKHFCKVIDSKIRKIENTNYILKSNEELENIIKTEKYNYIFQSYRNDIMNFISILISVLILFTSFSYSFMMEIERVNSRTMSYSENCTIFDNTVYNTEKFIKKLQNEKNLSFKYLDEIENIVLYLKNNKLFIIKGENEFKEAYKKMTTISNSLRGKTKLHKEFKNITKDFGEIDLLKFEKYIIKKNLEVLEFVYSIVKQLLILITFIFCLIIYINSTISIISKANQVLVEIEVSKARQALKKKKMVQFKLDFE